MPLAVLVGMFGLVLFGAFQWLTTAQDELQLAAEQRQVASALDSRLQAMRRNLADYTVWDDAVRHLSIRFDRAWAVENIAPYLYQVQQYDVAFVTDSSGRTLIASEGNQLTDRRPADILGKPFAIALAKLRRDDPGADRRIVGITQIGGEAAMFGVGGIVPSKSTHVPPGRDRYLTVVRLLDPADLIVLGNEFGIEALHAERRNLHDANLPITDMLGRRVANLNWESARPGSALRERYMPHLLLTLAMMAAVAGTVLRHGRRALVDAMKARLRAEREARSAQEALRELETARRRIAHNKSAFANTLQRTVAAKDEEHDRLISSTLEQRRGEMIAAAEDYQQVVALVADTLNEAAEALGDVARAPCGEVSASQLLASAGDLQQQALYLEDESRHFVARLRAA